MVIFTRTFDGRNHGSDQADQEDTTTLPEIKGQYISFIESFDSHYVTLRDGTPIDALQELFGRTAMNFALTVFHYYEVCVEEERCNFSYKFTPDSLQRTLYLDLLDFHPDLAGIFWSKVTQPIESRRSYTIFVEDLGRIEVSARCMGVAPRSGKLHFKSWVQKTTEF
jgi:hypothetical protein